MDSSHFSQWPCMTKHNSCQPGKSPEPWRPGFLLGVSCCDVADLGWADAMRFRAPTINRVVTVLHGSRPGKQTFNKQAIPGAQRSPPRIQWRPVLPLDNWSLLSQPELTWNCVKNEQANKPPWVPTALITFSCLCLLFSHVCTKADLSYHFAWV